MKIAISITIDVDTHRTWLLTLGQLLRAHEDENGISETVTTEEDALKEIGYLFAGEGLAAFYKITKVEGVIDHVVVGIL